MFGLYCRAFVISDESEPSLHGLIPRRLSSLSLPPVATPGGFDSISVSFFAVRFSTTTLTHSSNVRSLDRLCPPSAPFKTWSIRHHSALRMVSCLSSGRTPHTSLAAWFPSSLRGKERPFPRKPVTLASDYLPHLRVAHRFYTDLSKGPGTSVRPDRCVRLSSDSIPERVVL
jgi:hypothetical protein